MLTLDAIEQICDNIAGVTTIYITDPNNVDEAFNALTPAIYYKIEYQKNSGKYNEKSQRGDGGDYADQELTFFLPKRRAAVQTMIRRCADRRISAFFTTKEGSDLQMINCRFTYEYTSGQIPGEQEGYTVTLVGTKLNRGYSVVNGNASPAGNNLTVPGDMTQIGTTPVGNEVVAAAADCCVTIQTAPLLYVPPLTGNDTLLNMFVIGSDGNRYFIDSQGVSLKVHSEVQKHRVVGPTEDTVFTLPWQVIDPKNLAVFRNGVFSKENPPPTDINEHSISTDQATIAPNEKLAAGEYIDFLLIQ